MNTLSLLGNWEWRVSRLNRIEPTRITRPRFRFIPSHEPLESFGAVPVKPGYRKMSGVHTDGMLGHSLGRLVGNADNGESALVESAFIRLQATPKRMRPCATMPLHYPSYGRFAWAFSMAFRFISRSVVA